MTNFLTFLKNILFLFCIGLFHFFAYLLVLAFLSYALVEMWLFYSNYFLNTPSFYEWLHAEQGYLAFAILWLLLVGGLFNFDKNHQIYFTVYYLKCFSTPKNAVYFWLTFRFYLALLLSCILVYTSLKSQINLCGLDALVLLSTEMDPSVFFGKYLQEGLYKLNASTFNLLFFFY